MIETSARSTLPPPRGRAGITPVIWTAWLVLAATACRSATDKSQASENRRWDSAGIEIVDNFRPRWDANTSWTIDSNPALVIDDSSSGVYFQGFQNAATFKDGSIALTEANGASSPEPAVHLLDSTGRYVRKFGRRGDGPGEFRTTPIFVEGNSGSLVCYDMTSVRMAWFSSDGTLRKHVQFDATRPQGPGYRFSHAAPEGTIRADGAFLALVRVEPRMQAGLQAGNVNVFLVRDSARRAVPLGFFLQSEWYYVKDGGNLLGSGNPFGHRQFAVGPDPLPLYTFGSNRWQIEQHDSTGKLKRIIRLHVRRLPVPEHSIAAARGRFEIPDSLSPIVAMTVDPNGLLWVTRWDADSSPRQSDSDRPLLFDIIDVDGTWLGSIRPPQQWGLAHIGTRYLTYTSAGEDDRPQLRIYRIRRT